MKKIRYWAIASLFSPLGLVVTSCYQDPTQTEDLELDREESEYIQSNPNDADSSDAALDQEESTGADSQALEPVCRPLGWACGAGWQCCTGNCWYGVCRAGYPGYPGYPGYFPGYPGYPGYFPGYPGYCQPRGTFCYSNLQCCSGNCLYGVCRTRIYY